VLVKVMVVTVMAEMTPAQPDKCNLDFTHLAEENFHGYFLDTLPDGHPVSGNHARYGVP
jgi:hypothetical protein